MASNEPFHHFLGYNLNRSEKIQAAVIHLLLKSNLPNEKRESSIEWELKHSASCCQLARILAEERGLDVEKAEVIAVLHDIHVIVNGTYKNHGPLGGELARKMLKESNDFTEKEIKLICEAIANHSDKHIYSDKPYVELAKDVDTIDCFLYTKTGYASKPPEIRKEYFKRVIKIRKELGLPEDKFFKEELAKIEEECR